MDHLDQKHFPGNSLVVHWLGLCAFIAEGQVQSLAWEKKKKKKKRKIQNVLKEKKTQNTL